MFCTPFSGNDGLSVLNGKHNPVGIFKEVEQPLIKDNKPSVLLEFYTWNAFRSEILKFVSKKGRVNN